MEKLSLNPQSTALVLIDLQQGIVGMATAPHPAAAVVASAAACRAIPRPVRHRRAGPRGVLAGRQGLALGNTSMRPGRGPAKGRPIGRNWLARSVPGAATWSSPSINGARFMERNWTCNCGAAASTRS